MWARLDNGKYLTWNQANDFCRKLKFLDYSDWRLPTIDEFARMYDRTAGGDFYIKGGIHLTACCPWSSSAGGAYGEAWGFDFHDGKRRLFLRDHGENARALCVRRRGE